MRTPLRRERLINWQVVGPTIGYALTAVAIVAAVVHFTHQSEPVAGSPTDAVRSTPDDGLARELAHCQEIGARAENDLKCITAWAENRRRFFNGSSTEAPPVTAKTGEAVQP